MKGALGKHWKATLLAVVLGLLITAQVLVLGSLTSCLGALSEPVLNDSVAAAQPTGPSSRRVTSGSPEASCGSSGNTTRMVLSRSLRH